MAAFDDFDVAGVVERRTAVVAVGGQRGEAGEHVDLGQRQRGLPDAPRLGGDGGAQLGKQAPLDLDHLLLRVEHLGFVFLQLRRGEALGVDQRLLAFVVGGRVVQIGLGDFQVVAEDAVELDLQRADAGALALALLDLRDVLLAVAAEVAQFVERGIDAGANHAAVVQRERRLVFQR